MEQLLEQSKVGEMGRLLAKSGRIVLTCHVRPDGDALGTVLGLNRLFQAIGKESQVVIPDQGPRNLSFLPGFRDMAVFTLHPDFCRKVVAEADLILCCDFNKPSRQDKLAPLIQGASCPKVLVDHHQDPDDFADLTFSYPDMSSTCELAFRLLAALGLYVDLDRDAAVCLLTGIVTDTRNFSVNVNHIDLYDILMKLMEKGADKTRIVKLALETRSYWSLKLESYALAEKLEIFREHHAAVTTLDQDELRRFHYEKGDTEGLVNKPLEIRGVVCSFFLRQDEDVVKVSARSVCDFPVSEVCEQLYGGGGHRMAAGAEFHGSLEECRRMLVEALPRFDKYVPRNMEGVSM